MCSTYWPTRTTTKSPPPPPSSTHLLLPPPPPHHSTPMAHPPIKSTPKLLLLLLLLLTPELQPTDSATGCCQKHQEAEFLDAYETIIGDSYSKASQTDPASLLSSCAAQGTLSESSQTTHTITADKSSSSLTSVCGVDCALTVPTGTTLTINSNLNVAAMEVGGSVIWEQTANSEQFLCAGYIGVTGSFTMNLQSSSKTAYVYIKNNGLKHFLLGSRALGAYQNDESQPPAVLEINGNEMRRTWSLLSTPLTRIVSNDLDARSSRDGVENRRSNSNFPNSAFWQSGRGRGLHHHLHLWKHDPIGQPPSAGFRSYFQSPQRPRHHQVGRGDQPVQEPRHHGRRV